MPNPLNVRSLRQAWRRKEVLDLYSFPAPGGGPSADPACELREATAEVLTQLRSDYPNDLNERKYSILMDRLNDPADRTLVIHDEHGEPCGYCHITTGNTVNARIKYPVKVRADQAYFWDDHLFMAHRRRGLHSFSIARRLEMVAHEGATEALTIISRPNLASQRSYAQFGTVPRRVLIYLPAMGRTLAAPPAVASRIL